MMSDMAEHKIFDGLCYARDPMMNGVVQIVIKDKVGSSGAESVITMPVLTAMQFGALLTEMSVSIFRRGMK